MFPSVSPLFISYLLLVDFLSSEDKPEHFRLLHFGKDRSSANCCPVPTASIGLLSPPLSPNPGRSSLTLPGPPQTGPQVLGSGAAIPGRETRRPWQEGTDAGFPCARRAWETQRGQRQTQNAALPPQGSPLLPEIANTSKTRALRGTLWKGKP